MYFYTSLLIADSPHYVCIFSLAWYVCFFGLAIKQVALQLSSVWDPLRQVELMSVQVDVVSCNAAITACGKASQWQNAMQLLSHMGSGSMAPDVITYSAAASACEREWTQALQLLSEARWGGAVSPKLVCPTMLQTPSKTSFRDWG